MTMFPLSWLLKNLTVTATKFKAECLAYLDEVEQRGGSITITRRGRPVAVLARAKRVACKSSRNSLAAKVRIVGDT
jgi:prevent-host-death family protein